MQYMILIYEDEKQFASCGSGDERVLPVCNTRRTWRPPECSGGRANRCNASTVRGAAKTATTDGPLRDQEQLGGYYILDVANLDGAMGRSILGPLGVD